MSAGPKDNDTLVKVTNAAWNSDLAAVMNDMREMGILCDTAIISEEKEIFMCHGVVLAAASPTLKTLLKKHQSSGSQLSFAFRLDTIPGRVIKVILDFVYSGKLLAPQDDIQLLYQGADVLQMSTLTDVCLKVGEALGLAMGEDADSSPTEVVSADVTMSDVNHGEDTSQASPEDTAEGTGDAENYIALVDQTVKGEEGAPVVSPVTLTTEGENHPVTLTAAKPLRLKLETDSQGALQIRDVREVAEMLSASEDQMRVVDEEGHETYIVTQEELLQNVEAATDYDDNIPSLQAKVASQQLEQAVSNIASRQLIMRQEGGDVMGMAVAETAEGEHQYLQKVDGAGDNQTDLRLVPEGQLIYRDDDGVLVQVSAEACRLQAPKVKQQMKVKGGSVFTTYSCELCLQDFPSESLLKSHLWTHEEYKNHTCAICGKDLMNKKTLKRHMLTHMVREALPFKCQQCGKGFREASYLNRHKLAHTKSKKYKCEVCGKTFAEMSLIKRHLMVHNGVNPYSCDTCGASFEVIYYLKKHLTKFPDHRSSNIRSVTEHPCVHCGQVFQMKYSLKQHQMLVHGVKKYTCSHCSKGFNDWSNMKRHEQQHTGEKKYKCGICDQRFTQNASVKTHMKKHLQGHDNSNLESFLTGHSDQT